MQIDFFKAPELSGENKSEASNSNSEASGSKESGGGSNSGNAGGNSSEGGDSGGGSQSAVGSVKETAQSVAAPVFSRESINWATANWHAIGIAFAASMLLYIAVRWMRHRLRQASDKMLEKGQVRRRGITSIPRRVIMQTGPFFLFVSSLRFAAYVTNAPTGITELTKFLFQIMIIIQLARWMTTLIIAIIDQRIMALTGQRSIELMNARQLISFLVKAVTYSLATLSVLEVMGVNVTALVAGLGIGSVAVGLAAKNIFSDLFAALSIVVDRPFLVGDKIEFDGVRGYVKKTGLQTTILTTNNGDELIVSNANLLDTTIINWSRAKKKRSRLNIDIDAATPIDVARGLPKILKKVVGQNDGKIQTEDGELEIQYVRSGFDSFSSGGYRFKLIYDVMTEDYNDVIAARHRVGMDVIEALRKEDILFDFEAAQLLAVEGAKPGDPLPFDEDSAEDRVMSDTKHNTD